jgi:hypothetical protein
MVVGAGEPFPVASAKILRSVSSDQAAATGEPIARAAAYVKLTFMLLL